jgi:AAA family ATP:ADP antiporter
VAEASRDSSATTPAGSRESTKETKGGAFQLVFRSRYLLLIGTLMLLLNLVNTTGEFLLGSLVKEHVAQSVQGDAVKVRIGEFYSSFFFWVNSIGAVVQLFVTPRLIRHFGIRTALLVMPLFSLFGYGAASLLPLLAVVRWGKTSENALDYSLNNTVRNALFLPLGSEEKYKAKQVVDTLFVRAGDVISAGLVFVGLRFLHLPLRGFAMVNFVVVLLWLWVAWALGRAYVKRSDEGPEAAP